MIDVKTIAIIISKNNRTILKDFIIPVKVMTTKIREPENTRIIIE